MGGPREERGRPWVSRCHFQPADTPQAGGSLFSTAASFKFT